MVQLLVLSGPLAGTHTVARQFPFCIGRSREATLRLEAPGVWERHARLEFVPREGFRLVALGDALVAVNDQPVRETLLRNGDRLTLGSVQLRFALSGARQRRLGWLEALVWGCVAVVTLAQLILLYRLLS